MAIPGVEGTSLVGKAPDVTRPHDSNQQHVAAQAAQDAGTARRADERRRRAQAAPEAERTAIRDERDRRGQERPAPRYRPDAEINGDEETEDHEIDTRA